MTTFTIRPATEDERGLAYSAWWKQMANLRPPGVPKGLWRRGCQENVMTTLQLSQMLVTTFPDDTTDVLGLVCFSGSPEKVLLHFVYVKFHVRKYKIATNLLRAASKDAEEVYYTTFPQPRFVQIILDAEWIFDPFGGTRLHYGPGPFQETKT